MINQVIPFMELGVEYNPTGEYLLITVGDLPACFVDFVDYPGEYLQPGIGYSFSSPLTGISGREQRSSAPRVRYLGEKPVFDWVVLGAIGRVVHHDNPHTDSVGEGDEVLFDDVVGAGIGSAAVAKDDEHFGIGIEGLEMLVPAGFDIVAYKLGGVVAGADGEIPGVIGDVVDSVRDNCPVGESGEVVVKGLRRRCAEYGSLSLEVADKFLFLGVDADNRDAGFDTQLLGLADFLELLVPVLDFAHRDILAERPRPETALLDESADVVCGYLNSAFEKLPPDSGCIDVKPDDILVRRVPCHMFGHYFHKVFLPLRMLGYFVLRAASRPADSAVAKARFLSKFTDSLANRFRGYLENLAQRLYRKAVGPDRLARNKMPSLPFIECHKERFLLFFNVYWGFLLHFCNCLESNYKDTKISPFIHYLKC